MKIFIYGSKYRQKKSFLHLELQTAPLGLFKFEKCSVTTQSLKERQEEERYFVLLIYFRVGNCSEEKWKERSRPFKGLNNQKSRNGKYRCGSCEKEYVSKTGLKYHRRIHTGEKLFACDHCKQRFTQKGNLIRHLRIHTGEKPFSCDHCKRSFTLKHHLIGHLRFHTGEKPFSCDHCSQKFRFKRSLKYHITKHHNSNE
ncbi:gastrula zinc finger protein XlCGF49.1-like [Centruroides sculpturatus]|uniref:gastrula zinc finger protein XlCGF49.1-like n=1 Tax=Centruroides sculpturatus TaxID=218467 RepID=UPI000C6E8902|nr:gastrula zinc finger protein XlCGF49.1-like [Centruroides sculpturatus]